ncbi:hypothetical protein J0K78_04550 [Halobacillus sp. GSS1]|uniref:hypothetical protein n=1 Tax=Halobacillus sp. GSS1 TaxID=2815919 RepID=UPI001A8CABAC|nr:hypothetical protein [Halobacillus sp. GSS1]MBN9653529.1 hypothetical protein [Halobacillus sp. GSS1]
MKKMYPFLILLGIFALIGYMESPRMKPEEPSHYPISTEESETEAVAQGEHGTTMNLELELVYEGTKVVDGTKVEAYREYEVYKDRDGKVVNRIPTTHYNYLKYENQ